jgi:hypothetical protein
MNHDVIDVQTYAARIRAAEETEKEQDDKNSRRKTENINQNSITITDNKRNNKQPKPKKIRNRIDPKDYEIKTFKKPPIKNHPQIKQIEYEIIHGVPYSRIAERYNVTVPVISRYKKKYLAKKINKLQDKKDLEEGNELLKLLTHYIDNVNLVADACIDELRDPEDPDKLHLGAQARDITLTYYTIDSEGKEVKEKANLQALLDKVDVRPTRIEINMPDRAETLLKASHAMNKHIHLFGELKGMLGSVTINITNQPVFISFTQQVVRALEPYPEARKKVAAYLATLDLEDRTIK